MPPGRGRYACLGCLMQQEASVQPQQSRWSEFGIEQLRQGLLKDAMLTVVGQQGRTSAKARSESWRWIMAEEESPFSFNVCARSVGADPGILRRNFIRMVMRRNGTTGVAVARQVLAA